MPPADLILDVLLYAVLPATVAAAVVLTGTLFVSGGRAAAAGAVLAFVGGVAVGNVLRGVFPLRPGQASWEWLPCAALAALAVELLARLPGIPVAVGWLVRGSAAGLAAWLLVPADLAAGAWWALPAFAGTVLGEWWILDRLDRRAPTGWVPLLLVLALGAGATVLIHAHSARLTDAATLAAAAVFGIATVAWWWRAESGGTVPGVAVLLPGLLLAGQSETFSEVPVWSFVLVALAPLAAGPALLPVWNRLPTRCLRALEAALMLLPLVTAVILAVRAESLAFE